MGDTAIPGVQGKTHPHPKPKEHTDPGWRTSCECLPRLGTTHTDFSCRVYLLFDQCPGHNSGSSSPLESPDVQSSAAPAGLPDHCQHDGIPGKKLALLSPFPSTLLMVQGQNGGAQYPEWSHTRTALHFPLPSGSPQVHAQSLRPHWKREVGDT